MSCFIAAGALCSPIASFQLAFRPLLPAWHAERVADDRGLSNRAAQKAENVPEGADPADPAYQSFAHRMTRAHSKEILAQARTYPAPRLLRCSNRCCLAPFA